MKTKRIVYFYQYFGTTKGGWSTRVYEMCRRWVAMGYKVTVITTPYDKSDINPIKGWSRKFEIEGIEVVVLNISQSNMLSSGKRVFQFVKFAIASVFYALRLQYDVAICSSGPITVGLPGLVAKIVRRKKFVFEVRDLWPSGAIELGVINRPFLKKISYSFEAACYRFADLVVCCSNGMKQDIENRFHYKHLVVVSNACDIDLFKGASLQHDHSNKKYIVYTGSLGMMDHCMQIMQAIKEFNKDSRDDVEFIIAGDGIDRQRMMAFAEEYKLDNVKFTGLVPKTEIVNILSKAYCSIICFRNKQVLNTVSPNKMFDAFAAGVPIIQTTSGWIADLINEKHCGINVQANDPVEMANAFRCYLDNPEKQSEHSKNAYSLAQVEFSRDKCAEEMIKAIDGTFERKEGKNVWIINQFAGHEGSGWGERHYFMGKYWQEAGYTVNIISGAFNHMFVNLPFAPDKFNFERKPFANFTWVKTPVYNPTSVLRFWSMLVFAWRVFRLPVKKLGKPDIVLVSSMPIFPIVSGSYLKRKYKARQLIFEIRDIWPLTLIQLGEVSEAHPVAQFLGWFEKYGYKHADFLVTLLPYASTHIVKKGGREDKIRYIPNGLESEVMHHDLIPGAISDMIPSDKFIIGYTGTHSLANALDYLVEAAQILKDDHRFYFVLIGEGYKKEQLKLKASGLGNIVFLDKLPKSQMQDLISRFDICFVGRQDSILFEFGVSGNKYFDYMLAAKPILDSNNAPGSPAELAGAGIRVKAESAKAIVQGIIAFHQMSKEERRKMGESGTAYLHLRHRTSFLASSYISIFSHANAG